MDDLVGMALALGAESVAGWSPAERALANAAPTPPPRAVDEAREQIAAGRDPLGEAYQARRAADERRRTGATYTPEPIVAAMIEWAVGKGAPARVVDPGVGSGRFAVAAGRALPGARLLGYDVDPIAAILARGHLAAAGLAHRAEVIVGDYCGATLPAVDGPTLFIGNPPYVRHHELSPRQKAWLSEAAGALGVRASRLAGLHVHFFFATALRAVRGDRGVFVTAAEWLDVNYGRALRQLLAGALGLRRLDLVEPTTAPFPGAITTAAVAAFEVGSMHESARLRAVADLDALGPLAGGRPIARAELAGAARWTPLLRERRRTNGGIELGELCRVHRGQVTGANAIWIAGERARDLPERFRLATITRARELFAAAAVLDDASALRRVIDLPPDLDALDPDERRAVDRFLRWARAQGAADGYVARHRRAWWAVGLREPAPILASYMARRPPVFVRNLAGARHLNIAHGLYPREPMSACRLDALVASLNAAAADADGRTYAGGLTKFEPREMERIRVPVARLV